MKIEPMLECRNWSAAVIKQKLAPENPEEAIKVKITFKGDSNVYDRTISINSKDLAPCSEKSSQEDEEFRLSLKVGDNVDVYDSTRFWYASTILNAEDREVNGTKVPMVMIAFRIWHEKGDKTDKQGNKYSGWEEEFDEWITLRSPRITAYQKHTTDSLVNQTAEAQNANPLA